MGKVNNIFITRMNDLYLYYFHLEFCINIYGIHENIFKKYFDRKK